MDNYIPVPLRDIDKPFLMPIEDVFGIKGRGTVVTGRVERGKVKVGDEVEIVGFGDTQKKVITGVEMFHKSLDSGEAGDAVGCLLRGIERDDVERGQVLAKPGSILPHTEAKAEVVVLSKEEGGRHTPFFSGYKPQFYIRTLDVTGEVKLPEGMEMVMPGDHVNMDVKLIAPVALEEGLRFAVREGGRTVASRYLHRCGVLELIRRGVDLLESAGAMAKKGEARSIITLACGECRSRNYTTNKNRRNDPGRLELNKFCPRCRRHQAHREVR